VALGDRGIRPPVVAFDQLDRVTAGHLRMHLAVEFESAVELLAVGGLGTGIRRDDPDLTFAA
jgi:hypothetical protein